MDAPLEFRTSARRQTNKDYSEDVLNALQN